MSAIKVIEQFIAHIEAKNISRREAARLTGLPPTTVNRVFSGRRNLTMKNYMKIASYLDKQAA